MCSVSFFFFFWCTSGTYTFYRYHHDIESYKINKPLYVEGIDKVKDALNSFIGNRQQAAEVAGGVNIVSDGVELVDESASNDIAEATATQ